MQRHGPAFLACLAALLAATASAAAADDAHQRARACATLAQQYQRLEARMRSGYSARESSRLWEQRRRLLDRQWRLRCRDVSRPAAASVAGGSGR